MSNSYNIFEDVKKKLRIDLPEGVVHGSARAVRLGCYCNKCSEKRKIMQRMGTWRR